MVITYYGIPLAPVTSFKYLGIVILASGDDWLKVVHNLWQAQYNRERLSRLLSREDADVRTLGIIYVAVVQAVPLYGSETWVLTPCFEEILVRFRHRLARRLK